LSHNKHYSTNVKKSKKAIIESLKARDGKNAKFDALVLNLALQKIDSESFELDEDVVYSDNKSTLLYCISGAENITIPEGVTTIGPMAFRQKKHLRNVVIPSTVKVIEHDAFYDCDDLESIYVPASVESVRPYAFADCDRLKTVIFAGKPEQLSRHAFDESDDIGSIVVPAGCAKYFRKALHLLDGDVDMIVVEDPKNTKFLKADDDKEKKGKTKSAGKKDKPKEKGNKADAKAENKAEAKKNKKAEVKVDKKADKKADDKADEKTEKKTNDKIENKTDDKTVIKETKPSEQKANEKKN
jgi:hypothetical protein